MAETRNGDSRPVLNITFDSIRDKNVEQVKILNNVIFPVNYQEGFYRDCLACSDINLLALHNDISIGVIGSRLEKQGDGKAKLYIMTLGVLAPYRGRGVGSKLLEKVLAFCQQDSNIEDAYLHVQDGNDDVVKFYQKFGFRVTGKVEDYYRRLDPPGASVLSKSLVHQQGNSHTH